MVMAKHAIVKHNNNGKAPARQQKANATMGGLMNRKVARTQQMKEQTNRGAKKR